MPIDLRYERDDTVVRLTAHGAVTTEEFLRAHREMWKSDDRTRRYRGAISDWTDADVEQFDVSTDAVRSVAFMARRAQEITPHQQFGALVAPQPVLFGLSRVFTTFAETSGLGLEIFEETEEAERWMAEQIEAQQQATDTSGTE